MTRQLTAHLSRRRLGVILLGLVTAVLVAACGSSASSTHSTSASSNASSATATASETAATGVTIGTAHGGNGTYLTGAAGRAVYLWVADAKNMSSCSGACAQAWPPVTASDAPLASGGVSSADLGTITRPNGTKQVIYNGHPLYYFAGDPKAGVDRRPGQRQFRREVVAGLANRGAHHDRRRIPIRNSAGGRHLERQRREQLGLTGIARLSFFVAGARRGRRPPAAGRSARRGSGKVPAAPVFGLACAFRRPPQTL